MRLGSRGLSEFVYPPFVTRRQNALTEKAWKDAVHKIGKRGSRDCDCLGLNPKGYGLEKKFGAVFIDSIKRARQIRKFHLADLQWWLRNIQKKCDAWAKLLFFWYKPIAFLPFSLSSPSFSPLLWSRNVATIVACVASVSLRGSSRKLGQERKKNEWRGRGREKI